VDRLENRTVPAFVGAGDPVAAPALAIDPAAYDSDTILVRFRPEEGALASAAASPVVASMAPLSPALGLHTVHLAEGTSVETGLAALRSNPFVLYAEPNYRVQALLIPNDPRFGELYGLHNTGQSGGLVDADIDGPEAWDNHVGSGNTIVAVIDTGVDYNHPDLAANMWTNVPESIGQPGVDDDGNGFVDDIHGYDFVNNDGDPFDDHFHGTHVAGTIGAIGNNSTGVTGVNWNVQIMALKFLDAGGGGFIEDAIRAVDYAAANRAFISNNSWGGGPYSQGLKDAIDAAGVVGHVFVAAAGNSGSNNDQFPMYPASYSSENIIAVAATDRRDQRASFSSYGATTVDLGAPGVDILSTLPGNSYGYLSGTSMATPHVAGVVALVRDLHPTWTYSQVKDQILSTVDPLASLNGITVTGGRVNAAGAATGEPPPDTQGPYVAASSPSGSVNVAVSSIRLTFNEAVGVGTFTLADIVSFSGPSGDLLSSVSDVVPVLGSGDKQFDVLFASQSELGSYQMVLGPDLTDAVGNAMNQDRDDTNGEVPDDRYTASFSISEELEFCSTDTPLPIFDFSTTISQIFIDQHATINDLDITLNITHTYDADLTIYLVAPDGSFLVLVQNRGGSGDNFSNTRLDDEASTPISAGSAPFAGSYRPEDPLSFLDGMDIFGTWQLWVADDFFIDEGSLNEWCMIVSPGGGEPPPGGGPPDAIDDNATTNEDTPVTIAVLANDTDPDNDPLRVTAVTQPANGSVTINGAGPNNTVTYTPDPNWNGTDVFTYTVSDGNGGFDTATVTVVVQPINDPPIAVDDQAVAQADTPLTFDGLGGNPARLEANDIDVDGDSLSVVAVANAVHGTAVLNGNGTVTFTPEADYAGPASFEYTVSDGLLTDIGLVQITIEGNYYFSTTTSGSLTGTDGITVPFTDADILRLAVTAGGYGYSLYFDGSDVGLTTANEDVDAFDILADGSIIISTVGAFSVPGPSGSISGGGAELLQFTPASLGDVTAGTWSYYFDGRDVGLNTNAERIDAVAVLDDGTILVSTEGAASVPGVAAEDEDLLRFTPTSLGSNTAGTWTLYFDGSDVGLGEAASEDINGLFVRPQAGALPILYLSTLGNFAVPGLSGVNEDVFGFTPTSLGSNTAGSYGSALTLDGSVYGLASFDVDGIHLGPAPVPGGGDPGPIEPPPPPPLPPAPASPGGQAGARRLAGSDSSFDKGALVTLVDGDRGDQPQSVDSFTASPAPTRSVKQSGHAPARDDLDAVFAAAAETGLGLGRRAATGALLSGLDLDITPPFGRLAKEVR
jgi:subtilisin family serine protease/subtilisin-like proprotein convertase family protein